MTLYGLHVLAKPSYRTDLQHAHDRVMLFACYQPVMIRDPPLCLMHCFAQSY